MRFHCRKLLRSWAALAGAGLIAVASPAPAQTWRPAADNPCAAPCFSPTPPLCPSPYPSYAPTPAPPGTPAPSTPSTTPTTPTTPMTTPAPGEAQAQAAPSPAAELPEAGGGFAALTGATASLGAPGGYLYDAIPHNQLRLRYDAGFGMNRPDRAEYFYAEWGELGFHPHGVNHGGIFFDPKARGPQQLPGSLNFQDASAYMEYAVNPRFSAFVEVPQRFVDFRHLLEDHPESETKRNPADNPAPGSRFFPEPNAENFGSFNNTPDGFSDLQVGIKAALLADPNEYLTFQLLTYIPTGFSRLGLGTGHVSLEPSLLYYQRLRDQVEFQAQFTDWIPVGGGAAAGNVLQYGVGVGYDVYHRGSLRVTPITELVGWTVLSGYKSVFEPIAATSVPGLDLPVTHGVQKADGDTIVNAKFGVRTYFGAASDIYIGYGHVLTGDRWYRDIVRVEYRIAF